MRAPLSATPTTDMRPRSPASFRNSVGSPDRERPATVTASHSREGAPMAAKEAPWTVSSLFLVGSGVLLIGVGFYFLFLRPSLLPEDIRYMNLTPAELQSIGSRLGAW